MANERTDMIMENENILALLEEPGSFLPLQGANGEAISRLSPDELQMRVHLMSAALARSKDSKGSLWNVGDLAERVASLEGSAAHKEMDSLKEQFDQMLSQYP